MRWVNRLLLGLELGLLLGLGVLLVLTNRLLVRSNRGSAVAQFVAPTPSPTALIRLAELPAAAHIHPDESFLPPPTPLSASVLGTLGAIEPGQFTSVPIPTPAAAHASRVVIAAIGVDAPVVHGTDTESLKLGVGHYDGSANPGERGNLILAGHNDIYGEVFRDLSDLQAGDEVTLYAAAASYRYVIRGRRLIDPSDVSVLEPTRGATLTLISCYPYRVDTQRIIVFGDLVEDA